MTWNTGCNGGVFQQGELCVFSASDLENDFVLIKQLYGFAPE